MENIAPGYIDFSRSYLYFRSTRVNHTPRPQLAAICTVHAPGQAARTFYMTCPFIGEEMYLEREFIQEPIYEALFIFVPREEMMVVKRHASAAHDVRSAFRFGAVMPTHDGRGSTVLELDAHVTPHVKASRIDSYETFRTALLDNHPIIGRTTYTDGSGARIVLDYPANTVNVAHDKEAWQVDAGPIVMPLHDWPKADDGKLQVEALELAYLVYNRWDYAEAVLRRPMPISDSGAATNHYSMRRNLECVNEMYAID